MLILSMLSTCWHSPIKSANQGDETEAMPMTERQLSIILAVVYEYIKTGEPARSRTIKIGRAHV